MEVRFSGGAVFPPVLFALIWSLIPSVTSESLRGLAAVDDHVVWASGTAGTWLRTTNGGGTWTVGQVRGAQKLDFRDVYAVDARTAYLLASGSGDQSRIYKTVDGGRTWILQFTNPDPTGFFDAFAFWDSKHGLALGDPVEGRFVVFITGDGGAHWERRIGPKALLKEGAFAASGTCLIARGEREAWFGTSGARVFHSSDGGASWTSELTPIRHDSGSAGIFSLAFADARHGVAVGGDYMKPEISEHNVAITSDGGRTWTEPLGHHPAGYRSVVVYSPALKVWLASGISGSDISRDNGANWEKIGSEALNALSLSPFGKGWAVGPKGTIAVLRPNSW